jgi:hypothetical protein
LVGDRATSFWLGGAESDSAQDRWGPVVSGAAVLMLLDV